MSSFGDDDRTKLVDTNVAGGCLRKRQCSFGRNSLMHSLLASHFSVVAAKPEPSYKRRKLVDSTTRSTMQPKKSVHFCMEANTMETAAAPSGDNSLRTTEDEFASYCSVQAAVQAYRYNMDLRFSEGGDQHESIDYMRGLEHAANAWTKEYKKRRGKLIRRAIVSAQLEMDAIHLASLASILTADDCYQAKELAAYDVLSAMCVYSNIPGPAVSPCTIANDCIGTYSLFSRRRQPPRLMLPFNL